MPRPAKHWGYYADREKELKAPKRKKYVRSSSYSAVATKTGRRIDYTFVNVRLTASTYRDILNAISKSNISISDSAPSRKWHAFNKFINRCIEDWLKAGNTVGPYDYFEAPVEVKEPPPAKPREEDRICPEHGRHMIDYGKKWYCLEGNHYEAKA